MLAASSAITFAARVLVGLILIVAGALKVGHFDDLASSIAGYRLLPAAVIAPLALFLPFAEIGVGLYLCAGLFTRTAAIVASVQFGLYAVAIASAVVRHLPANCGCFGPGDRAAADWPHVAIDAALAAAAALVAWRSPGIYALDQRMRKA